MENNVSQKKLFSSLGQGHEFELAMIKHGVTPVQVQGVIDGKLKIDFSPISVKRLVDCDAIPKILPDWQKEEHRKMGKVKLEKRGGKLYANGQEVIRYLSEKQENKKEEIDGHELRKELAGKAVLNACVLECLLKCPELIPEEWKTDCVYFWGTIFLSPNNLSHYVVYLRWDENKWDWSYCWLGHGWHSKDPAACLAA